MNKRISHTVISLVMVLVMVLGITVTAMADENREGAEALTEAVLEKLPEDLINYVVVSSPNQSLGDTQEVLIGIGNGEKELEDGILTYENTNTGDRYQAKRDDKSDEALSFKIDYDGKSEGVYKLISLSYTIDGEEVFINLSDIDVSATWNVDSESEADTVEVADKKVKMSSNNKAENVDLGNKAANGKVVIMLDPGHGGSETGAAYGGLLEKDLNLTVAYYCKQELETYANVDVYMTRYGDDYVGLEERTEMARNVGANAFVSIHMNSGGGNGAEVWYPNYNYNPTVGEIGYNLANCIQKNLVALGLRDRGLKIRNSANGSTYPDGSIADYYSVIHNSKRRGIPGIIVEHAFIDGDYSRLCDDNFLRELGIADATGIAQYYGLSQGEDLSQYEGAFDANCYRYFNQDLWGFTDQQCFAHWMNYGIWEGRAGSPVFRMSDYINYNPDLVDVFGYDFRSYARHFNYNGMSEGRRAIDSFNVVSYKNRYRDLRNAFGNDLRSYDMHYIKNGIGEGRETLGYENELVGGGVTNLWIFDFSDVYDYDYYRTVYPDLQAAFGINDTALLEHFVNFGMSEARQASPNFNVWAYAGRYEDLRNAFGQDVKAYYIHYITFGKAEGRIAV